MSLSKGQRGHQTQWAAQFAVASELCKGGYEVTFTSGNHAPVADLVVISPQKRIMFLVDVKGLHRKNPWLIKRKAPCKRLFYVLTFVPLGKPNQYFVIPQAEANKLIDLELARLGRPESYPVTGISWVAASEYRDKWNRLPK